ncbi:MAG TPA: hypothetical protein GXZ27_02740 [Thermoanaerobacterales bacterium]|nr:hypothetical protein [Thermoanaerobacterales bacterium]
MRKMSIILISLVLIALLAVGCGINAPKTNGDEAAEEGSDVRHEDASANSTANGSNNNEQPLDDGDTSVSHDVSFIIEEPKEHESVKSGKDLIVKGKTRVQEFSIEIEDGHNILGEAYVKLQEKPQELVGFEVTIELEKHTSPHGMIIFVTESKDGERQEDLILPIKYE